MMSIKKRIFIVFLILFVFPYLLFFLTPYVFPNFRVDTNDTFEKTLVLIYLIIPLVASIYITVKAHKMSEDNKLLYIGGVVMCVISTVFFLFISSIMNIRPFSS